LGTDLGGGLRKIRMAITSKGKGKSGGARVISFTVVVAVEESEINLLYIYDKAERSSISKKEIEELLRLNGLK
ncbi:type II toxin-antitoxin system RelE/ParE family toxin, partial [Bacteroides gallinaceum]